MNTDIDEIWNQIVASCIAIYACLFWIYLSNPVFYSIHIFLVSKTTECTARVGDAHSNDSYPSTEAVIDCDYKRKTEFIVSWAAFNIIPCVVLLVSVPRLLLKRRRVVKTLNAEGDIIQQISKSRGEYMTLHHLEEDSKLEVSKLWSSNTTSAINGFSHPNLLLAPIPENKFFITVKDLMLGVSGVFYDVNFEKHLPPPYFEAMSTIMRNALTAIHYLHVRKIYHLDLQPKNILVLNTSGTPDGYVAKVGGFSFAKSSDSKEVSIQDVGLDEFKRPPECFLEDGDKQIDGEKFDCWSIGITAYELFTGGMLTIEFSRHPSRKNLPDLARVSKVMELKYFVSAMDSRWGMKKYLLNTEPSAVRFWDLQGSDSYKFGKNYFDFVKDLLKFHPKLRSSVYDAFKTTLMKDVSNSRRTKGEYISYV